MSTLLIVIGAILIAVGLYLSFNPKSEEDATSELRTTTDSLLSVPNDSLSDNERKGQQFEDYIISRFSPANYSLVEKVNDYSSRHHTTERSKYADLVFRKKDTNEEFAVECKYRSGWLDSQGKKVILWVDQKKIDDYNQFSNDRGIDVIVVFGVGGTPSQPEEVYALPLRLLQKPLPQNQDFLRKYRVPDGALEYNTRKHNLQII